ncbi:hypothetical protein V502_03523, partial [Pseudogymnoascus sp. VKM F-4520 (FW-2644)]
MAAPAHKQHVSAGDVEVGGAEIDDNRDHSRISYVEATGAEVDVTREPSVKMQWGQPIEIDDSYLRASAFTKFWRSVLFQMILFGA